MFICSLVDLDSTQQSNPPVSEYAFIIRMVDKELIRLISVGRNYFPTKSPDTFLNFSTDKRVTFTDGEAS